MITIIDIIKAFREDGFRPTAMDVGGEKPVFCLGILLEEPIDIWYCQSVLNKNGWDIGAPYWFASRNILYFPDIKIDADSYRELING